MTLQHTQPTEQIPFPLPNFSSFLFITVLKHIPAKPRHRKSNKIEMTRPDEVSGGSC